MIILMLKECFICLFLFFSPKKGKEKRNKPINPSYAHLFLQHPFPYHPIRGCRMRGKKHEDGRFIKKVPVQWWKQGTPVPWCL